MQAPAELDITTSAETRVGACATKLRLLFDGRRKLLWGGFIGLVAGFLTAMLLPVQYESMAQLMPPDGQSGSGMAILAALSARTGSSLEGVSSDLLGIKSSGALFIGVLGSRTVQDRLSERFNLKQVYRKRLNEDVRRELAANTRAWEDRHSGIITVAVTDHDRQRAAMLTAGYVDELNRLVAELSTSAAHRERVFLEQRLADVKHDLDQVSGQFSQFSSKNTAIDIKEQGRAMIDVAASLTGQLIAAESEMTGLKQIYTANNVRVRAVEARVRELRSKLGELSGAETHADSKSADQTQPYPTLRQLPVLGVTYTDLYRQTKIQEAVYETLTEQYELAKVQEAKETPMVRMLDAPVAPERSSFPPRLQIMFFGMCLGFATRAVGIFARAHWQTVDDLDPRKVLVRDFCGPIRVRSAALRRNLRRVSAHLPWPVRPVRPISVLPADQSVVPADQN